MPIILRVAIICYLAVVAILAAMFLITKMPWDNAVAMSLILLVALLIVLSYKRRRY